MNANYIIPRDVLDKVFGGNPRARNSFELFQAQFSKVETATVATVAATTRLEDAAFITLSANAELPNERVLEVSTGELALTLSDGKVRLSLDDNAARAAGGRVTLVAEGQSRVAVPIEGHLITREEVEAMGLATGDTALTQAIADTLYEPLGGGTTLASGTYTPTLTNVANLDASTAYSCQYLRVGSVVTVSGRVDIDPTAAATDTRLGISLPVASALAAGNECAGTAFAFGVAGQGAGIMGDATNDRAEMRWVSSDLTNMGMHFSFTYRVI